MKSVPFSNLVPATLAIAAASSIANAQTIKLREYFHPAKQDAGWLYQGKDWDGNDADIRITVASTGYNLDLHTGRSKVRTYYKKVLQLKYETGQFSGASFENNRNYDAWFEYFNPAAPHAFYGHDEDSGGIRLDGGLVYPASVIVGRTYSPAGDAYFDGKFEGVVTYSMKVLDTLPVAVPAGTFADCVHLRFSRLEGGSVAATHDEWWARGVGMVRMQGISGDGKARVRLLVSSTILPSPEISVQQPVGTELADGKSKKSFGTQPVGKSGIAKTFTIRNAGTKPLGKLAVVKNGAHAKDFMVAAPASSTVAPGKSTTFKVTFKPTGIGTRTAAIHIKSNDANENPFDIDLSGLGVR